MASSSVSQEDHDVEHDFAMASRRAKVRSARANRAVNTFTITRGWCRVLFHIYFLVRIYAATTVKSNVRRIATAYCVF